VVIFSFGTPAMGSEWPLFHQVSLEDFQSISVDCRGRGEQMVDGSSSRDSDV